MITSLKEINGSGSQLSFAIGVCKFTDSPQLMVTSLGTCKIIGGVLSSTVIVCVATVWFPQPSSAVQVLVKI